MNKLIGVTCLLVTLLTLILVTRSDPMKGSNKGSKNILFFIGMTFYSHRMAMWPLVQRLADEGHHITFLSSTLPKPAQADSRVNEYVSEAMAEYSKEFANASLLNVRLGGFENAAGLWDTFMDINYKTAELLLQENKFMEWMTTAKFDLVITDAACDFGLILAHQFKSPAIIFSTTSPYPWQTEAIGAPAESWLPDIQWALPHDMTFSQRVYNVIRPIQWRLSRMWSYFPKMDELVRDKMGVGVPSLEELEKNVSLVLVNMHYAEDYARSLPPKVISIGGMQCFQREADTSQVDEDLHQFMEKSKDGFIYVSFGSGAQMAALPVHLQEIFFNVMRKSKINFILKWDGPKPENVPKNIFMAKWLPQPKILGHKNIKSFITHGGMMGTQESVCAGVPLIFLPLFGEQDFNANRHAMRGTGIKLDWATLNEIELEGAILKILGDSSFKRNMQEMSKLFQDRPESPVELGNFWVSYILRHGHVEALQSLGIWQTWYIRRNLDVWAGIFGVFIISFIILFKLIIVMFSCLKFVKLTGPKRSVKWRQRAPKKQN